MTRSSRRKNQCVHTERDDVHARKLFCCLPTEKPQRKKKEENKKRRRTKVLLQVGKCVVHPRVCVRTTLAWTETIQQHAQQPVAVARLLCYIWICAHVLYKKNKKKETRRGALVIRPRVGACVRTTLDRDNPIRPAAAAAAAYPLRLRSYKCSTASSYPMDVRARFSL